MKYLSIIKVFVLGLLIPMTMHAQQQEVHYLKSGYTQVLENGKMYHLYLDSLNIDGSQGGVGEMPAIEVDEGVTACIQLKEGQRLVVRGSNAETVVTEDSSYVYRACPGILIKEGGTLVVFGNGTVVARGGNASQGHKGKSGGIAIADKGGRGHHQMSEGGDGGIGGGGSAPGIGGRGGFGGRGGIAIIRGCQSGDDIQPQNGVAGHDGGDGESMGTLILIGDITLVTAVGDPAEQSYEYALHGCMDSSIHDEEEKIGAGGGGGSGGCGTYARYGIGGGAPGAGGGGSGAGGGVYVQTHGWYRTGQGGFGGKSEDIVFNNDSVYLSGMNGQGISAANSKGGEGGNMGQFGSGGTIYYTGGVDFSQATKNPVKEDTIRTLDDIPEVVRPYLARTITGVEWANGDKSRSYFLGQEMDYDNVVPAAADPAKGDFAGFVDQYGELIYDYEGKPVLGSSTHSFAYNNDSTKWYVNSYGDIELQPAYTGFVSIIVHHGMEDPNWAGDPYDDNKYLNPAYMVTERFTVMVPAQDSTMTFSPYVNSKGEPIAEIDKNLYPDAQPATLTLRGGQHVVHMVLVKYNSKQFNLKWNMDEEQLYTIITNPDDYTHAGTYPFGKAINPPAFREYQGQKFDHWDADYTGIMPQSDAVYTPVFCNVAHDVIVEQVKGCTLAVSETTGVEYQKELTFEVSLDSLWRLDSIMVAGLRSGDKFKVKDMKVQMPDEDVKVYACVSYHPYTQMRISLATEFSGNTDSIAYYVTKDKKTYYTPDNDYYKFPEASVKPLSELQYELNDTLLIVTDFKGDVDRNRMPHAYIIGKNYKADIKTYTEITLQSLGSVVEAFKPCFRIVVTDSIAVHDIEMELLWNEPRWFFNITTENMYDAKNFRSNGRDITHDMIAQDGDQITFKLKKVPEGFNPEDITIAYEDGFNHVLMTPPCIFVTERNDTLYSFQMPDADVEMVLNEGPKYSISAEENKFYDGEAPKLYTQGYAVAGAVVACNMVFNPKLTSAEQHTLYINGEPNTFDSSRHILKKTTPRKSNRKTSKSMGTKMLYGDYVSSDDNKRTHQYLFVMPEEDVVLSLRPTTGIDTVSKDRNVSSGCYDLMGRKAGRNQKGFVIVDGNLIFNK